MYLKCKVGPGEKEPHPVIFFNLFFAEKIILIFASGYLAKTFGILVTNYWQTSLTLLHELIKTMLCIWVWENHLTVSDHRLIVQILHIYKWGSSTVNQIQCWMSSLLQWEFMEINGFGVQFGNGYNCSSLPLLGTGSGVKSLTHFRLVHWTKLVSPKVHISCQSSESLNCSAPLGTDRMDPGWI